MAEHKLAHILRAIADGKTVQTRARSTDGFWADLNTQNAFSIFVTNPNIEYRIKPKPLVKKWRWVCEDSRKYMTVTTKHYSSAEEFNKSFPGVKAVQPINSTMIEVEEDDE